MKNKIMSLNKTDLAKLRDTIKDSLVINVSKMDILLTCILMSRNQKIKFVRDGKFYVVFIHSVGLSAYGETKVEALKRLISDVIPEYLRYSNDDKKKKELCEIIGNV